MDASYLRVKNWSQHQHYSDRRPPWIKVYQRLLGDDHDFERLDEFTQWQLVRIWIVASRSSAMTVDENGKHVPVVANDAASLQRSIMSLRKVPLAKLIQAGWLIPVAESQLLPSDEVEAAREAVKAKRRASRGASNGASAGASASLRSRGREVQNVQDEVSQQDVEDGLPFKNELLCARLIDRIGNHADDGTAHVVRSLAARASEAQLAKVIESLDIAGGNVNDRAKYAVVALRDEIKERSEVA